MRRPIQKNDALTIAAARTQLKLLLSNARSLDHLTVDTLVRSYRVPPKEIEYLLTIEKQRRAVL